MLEPYPPLLPGHIYDRACCNLQAPTTSCEYDVTGDGDILACHWAKLFCDGDLLIDQMGKDKRWMAERKWGVINWLADMGEVSIVSVSDLPSKLTMKYFIHRPEPSCFVFVDIKYFFFYSEKGKHTNVCYNLKIRAGSCCFEPSSVMITNDIKKFSFFGEQVRSSVSHKCEGSHLNILESITNVVCLHTSLKVFTQIKAG